MSLLSNRLNHKRNGEAAAPVTSSAERELLPLPPMVQPLSAGENECKQQVYQELLKVMDLSLIDSLEEKEARRQIAEICLRLMEDKASPFSQPSRQRMVRQIEDVYESAWSGRPT